MVLLKQNQSGAEHAKTTASLSKNSTPRKASLVLKGSHTTL